jgi:hypothetical protein
VTVRPADEDVEAVREKIASDVWELAGDDGHCLACPLGMDAQCFPVCAIAKGVVDAVASLVEGQAAAEQRAADAEKGAAEIRDLVSRFDGPQLRHWLGSQEVVGSVGEVRAASIVHAAIRLAAARAGEATEEKETAT